MFIQFKELTIKNFMSAGNTPFSVDLTKSNKTLIRGANGNGKTLILNALTYALFGRAYAKIKLDSLVNSINAKDCVVTLLFEIGSDKYKIVRGQKPKIFQIFKNDELIKQDSLNKDYQLYLEDYIIKMTYNTYCQLMALGSSSYVPFLQLKAPERRAFVEFMLDIELFTGMNKQLKDMITQNKNEIFETGLKVDSYKKSISTINDIINWVKNDNNEKFGQIYDKMQTQIEDYKTVTTEIESIKELASKILVDDDVVAKCRLNISKCDKLLTQKETEAEAIRKRIAYLQKNQVCTVCNQTVDEGHKEKHLTEYNTELSTIGEIILKVKVKAEDFNKELEIFNRELKEKQRLNQKIYELETRQNSLKANIKQLKAEHEKLSQNIDSTLITDKTKQLKDEEGLLVESVEKYEKALTLKRVFDIIQTDLKDSGAKAEIIKTYIPIINTLVNKYLQKMNLFVKFQLDENFNETLKSRQRDEFTYESFSMGERMRISLALLFAWRELTKIRTGVSSNLLFFDEILEILDEDGFNVLLGLVADEQKTNCFVISHKQGLDVLFDDVITVQKVKGFTQIQIES